MIGEIIATIGLIHDFMDDHPDIAKMLMEELKDLLGMHKDEPIPNVEAMRGLAAGMAAARANAVQEFVHRKARADAKAAGK